MARVDHLDEDLKQVLRLASVIGRSFFYRVLAAVADMERQLDESLEGLQARELVLEKARDPELEYVFKHALVQEATYESVLRERRRELHARVGRALEALFAGRLEDVYALLAYHYTKAEEWEKAQEYLFKAADQAGTIAADAEALDHYEQALEAYTVAYGERWDSFERATVEHRIGLALLRSGAHEAAREHLFRALALLGHTFPQTPGALRRGLLRQLLTQAWHRLFPWAGRRPVTDEERRAGEECVWITEAVGHLTVFADQRELLFNMLLALNVSESIQLTYMTSVCCGVATFVCDQIPLHRLARMYARRTRELAEQADDAYAWGNAGMFLGMHEYTVTGDWKAALADVDRGREELWALGRLRLWGDTTLASVMVLTDMGEIGRAEAQAAEMIACGQQTGDRAIECLGARPSRLGAVPARSGRRG